MISRGYRGEPRLIDDFRVTRRSTGRRPAASSSFPLWLCGCRHDGRIAPLAVLARRRSSTWPTSPTPITGRRRSTGSSLTHRGGPAHRAARRQRLGQVDAAAGSSTGSISPSRGRIEAFGEPLSEERFADDEHGARLPPPRRLRLPEPGRAALQSDRLRRDRLRAAADGLAEGRGAPARRRRRWTSSPSPISRTGRRIACPAARRSAWRSPPSWCSSREVLLFDEPTASLDPQERQPSHRLSGQVPRLRPHRRHRHPRPRHRRGHRRPLLRARGRPRHRRGQRRTRSCTMSRCSSAPGSPTPISTCTAPTPPTAITICTAVRGRGR